jgi:hypothetical protein
MQKRVLPVLYLTLAPLLWLAMARADVQQAEENPSATPESDLVLTNGAAQLTDLFLQGYSYPTGAWVWQPSVFEPMTIVWADTNALPTELAGVTNSASAQVQGVPAWPLWVTLYPQSNTVVVLQPWSDTELAELAVPQGFPSWEIYQSVLYPSCILSVINPTNWQALAEQGYSQFAVPQVVMHAWLMDVSNQATYWSSVEAEAAAQSAESGQTAGAASGTSAGQSGFMAMADGEGDGGGGGDPCSITNLTQPFSITSIQRDTNAWTTITWQSCPIFRYVVLSTDELSTNTAWLRQAYVWGWGQTNATSWTDTTTANTNVTQRFYKVQRILGNQIAAGADHSLAALTNGILFAWGYNAKDRWGWDSGRPPQTLFRYRYSAASAWASSVIWWRWRGAAAHHP